MHNTKHIVRLSLGFHLAEYVLWVVVEGFFFNMVISCSILKSCRSKLANRKFVKKLRIKINKSISWIVKNPGFFFGSVQVANVSKWLQNDGPSWHSQNMQVALYVHSFRSQRHSLTYPCIYSVQLKFLRSRTVPSTRVVVRWRSFLNILTTTVKSSWQRQKVRYEAV